MKNLLPKRSIFCIFVFRRTTKNPKKDLRDTSFFENKINPSKKKRKILRGNLNLKKFYVIFIAFDGKAVFGQTAKAKDEYLLKIPYFQRSRDSMGFKDKILYVREKWNLS